MAERKIRNDRERIVSHLLEDHLVDERAVPALVKLPEQKGGEAFQPAGQLQLGKEPVQSIRGLSAVFHEEHDLLQLWKKRR